MKKRIVPAILVFLACVLVLYGCGKKQSSNEQPAAEETHPSVIKLTNASITAIGLQTEAIREQPFTHYLTIPAKVLANQDNEALVGSLVEGRVCKVFVKAGDYVKAGQVLMLVEGLEIGDIKARFISARANLEYRKSHYERQQKLLAENAGAQKNLLEAQNEYEKARAEYGAEKNRINAIGLSDKEISNDNNSTTDDRCTATLPVKSPISGIVAERNVVIGQLIEAATNAFKIINLRSVWVDGQMYEKDITAIISKTTADFSTASFPDEHFYGTIAVIGQMIDEKTRTITVRADFNNANGKLKPQMFGELKIPCRNNPKALIVPAEALVKIDNADFVFVQKNAESFEKRLVTIGGLQNELAEITKGLSAGENVVVKGAFYLKGELMKASFGEGE